MLSTDQNPSSSCPQTTSPPTNSSSDYEKNTSGNSHNAPLAKFSIRDYVRNTRRKDIANHWPFSLKNLQLCLKHGVHDVLPPFQALDSVRNSLTVESTNENITNSDVKLPGFNDVGEKLAYESSVSKEGKEKFSNLFKKRRLVVKSSNSREPKPNEELSVSETMASKVCPVCKMFSSSSNTTLNAHIDQCLSSESTVKWTADSKVVKHRIKPRKTKSMADVYATSVECTLDDLDRRNGTNWASSSDSPTQEDIEMCADEENHTKNDAIYFDSNGTKLQMLSRFNDLQATLNTKHDHQDRASKLASRMKEKQRSSSPCPKQTYHEVNKGKQRKSGNEDDKNEESVQPFDALDQMRFNYYGVVKQREGSKRTIAKAKIDREHERQSPNKTINYLRANSNLSCKRTCLVMEQPRLQKIRHCKRSIPSLPECTAEQLKKSDGPSVDGHHADPPSGEESHIITSDCAMLSQDNKLPCLRKTIRTSRRSLQQPKTKPRKKKSNIKEPRRLRASGSAVEAIVPAVSTGQTPMPAEKFSHKLLRDQANFLATAKKRDSMNSTKDGGLASKSSYTSPKSDAIKDVEIHEGFIRDPSSKGKAFLTFGEVETSFRGLTEQHSHAEQEIFGADKDGERLDAEDSGDYFVDANPIPIPGPPGSFFPSPGQMGSEELRGNSSLTTYRVHSSEDHGRIDVDLSDSPVSAMSSAARLYSTSILNSRDQSHCVQNEPQHNISENQTDKKLRLDESSTFKNVLPCCCFMKEGILKERSSFNYQLSELQGQRTVASYERQVEYDPAREDTTVAANSSMGNSEAKLQVPGDCELPSPLVLRLMGKNLTIVNKVESLSKNLCEQVQARVPQLRTTDSSPDNKSKGRIRISDSPDPGSNFSYEGMVNMESSVRISASMDVSNPFYNYQARCFPTYDVSSQTVQNATTRASTAKLGMNENSVNWDPMSPGGSSVLHPAASCPSTTGHPRSTSLYFTSAEFFMPKNFTC